MIDTAKAAKRLGCSQRHVLCLIAAGKLVAVDVGAGEVRPTYRIPEESIDAYIRARCTAPDMKNRAL